MQSQKPRQLRVSYTAAEAFAMLVREKNLDSVTETAWKDAPSGEENPPLVDFESYWSGVLGDDALGRDLLSVIPGLVAKYPVPGEGADPPRPGVTYISDVEEFKKGLLVSMDPGPMVQWGDLPVSKF